MADVKIRSVSATLNTSTGTQDVTLSGFGTPKGAIAFWGGDADATQRNHAVFGVGFTDGTNSRLATVSAENETGASSDAYRLQRNDKFIDILDGASTSKDHVVSFNSWITDGVRLNIDAASASVRTVIIILIGGSDVSGVVVGDINLGTGTSAITETIGQTSDIILTCGNGSGSYGSVGGQAIFSMGMYVNDGSNSQVGVGWWSEDQVNPSDVGGYFSNANATMQAYNGSVAWQAAISNVTSTAFDITPTANAGSDTVNYISIATTNSPDISLDFMDGPTATGDYSSTAPGFLPDFALAFLSDATTVNTLQAHEALSVAAFDGTNVLSLSTSNQDATNPPIAKTEFNSGSIDTLEDATTDSYIGTFSSFDATGFTLNFSTVPASARKWAVLTVGPAAPADITMNAEAGTITVTGQDAQLISPATIATTTANLSAPNGHSVVTLSGEVTLDGGFTVQPIVGDQIIYPSVLTVDAELNISGPSGAYVLYHIVASSGLTYHTDYTVSAGAGYTDSVTVNAGDPYTIATLATGFDPYIFEGWSPQPVAGQQLITETGNGYFDNFGNYYSELEHVHDAWHIALDGTCTHFTIDSTGLGTGVDTIPDAPVFTPLVGQAINTQIESNQIIVSGITASTPISISVSANGEYAISTDDGSSFSAWLTSASTVQLNDRVKLRTTTPAGYLTNKIVTLNINGVQGNWSLTTLAADITPADFTFTALTGQNVNVIVESNAINVLDVSAGYDVPVIISNGKWSYSTDDGETYSSWTSAAGNVRLGYRVKVRHTTSINYETETYTTIDIGTKAASFITTTISAALDISPDAFAFTDLIDQATNTVIESNALQITGLTAATDVSIAVSGGEYAISTDGGNSYSSFTNTPATIQNGNYLKLRLTSSANYYIKKSVAVTIGTYSSTWSVTTLSLSIPQFNVNDPSVFVERFYGDSFRVRVIKGFDNWVKFEVYNNGSLMNLSNGTDFKVIATASDGTEYTLNRVASPNYFTILASIGVIEIMLGQISAPVGTYDLDLVYFDALHTTGAYLNPNKPLTLELV